MARIRTSSRPLKAHWLRERGMVEPWRHEVVQTDQLMPLSGVGSLVARYSTEHLSTETRAHGQIMGPGTEVLSFISERSVYALVRILLSRGTRHR